MITIYKAAKTLKDGYAVCDQCKRWVWINQEPCFDWNSNRWCLPREGYTEAFVINSFTINGNDVKSPYLEDIKPIKDWRHKVYKIKDGKVAK